MSKNLTEFHLSESLLRKIAELEKEIANLKTNQLKTIVIPKVTADPSSPVDGQIWLNTSSNIYKIRINGVTKNVTVT